MANGIEKNNSHVFANLKYEEAIKHVINNINNGKASSSISIDEAIKSLKIVLGIKKSLNNSCTVSFKG